MHPLDCTKTFRQGRTLEELVTQYILVSTSAKTPTRRIFTHYAQTSAARLDRMYMTRILTTNKISSTAVVAAFKDHLAVVLQIDLHIPVLRCGRVKWKLNLRLLGHRGSNDRIKAHRKRGRQVKSDMLTWTCGGWNNLNPNSGNSSRLRVDNVPMIWGFRTFLFYMYVWDPSVP